MRRASINVLLSGLSATNLLLLLIVVPTFALPPLAGETLASSNMLLDFTHYMIVYAYPFCLTLQTASVWIFCLITVERYLAVCRPLLVGQLCSPARSRLALAAVYLAASAYNAVRFWEYRTADCGDPGLCGTVVTEPLLRADVGYWLWYGTVLYLLTQFLLPFLLMLTLNTAVVYRMYKCRKTVARKSSHFGRRTARKQISGDKTPVINLFRLRTSSMNYEHRTALMMLIIVFVFVTCYALSFLLNFAEAVDPELFYRPDTSALAYLLNDLSNALVVLNSASTWLVYLAMSGRYRRLALGALFACLPRRLRPPSSPDPFSSLAPSTIGMRKSPYRKSRSSAGLLLSLNDTDRNGEKAQLHRPLLSRNSVSGPFDLHRARQL